LKSSYHITQYALRLLLQVIYFEFLFYRPPEEEEQQTEQYKKDKWVALIYGSKFEHQLCALVFVRIKNMGYKFKLASKVRGLGKFNDVVVEYSDDIRKKFHIFVHLNSETRQRIKMKQLLADRGDFSLSTFYDSYIQIEEKFNCNELGVKMDGSVDDSLFVLYTNGHVATNLLSNKATDIGEEKFLMTGGSVLRFNEEEHKAIYDPLQDLPKHREFLSQFIIFYSQADEKQMDLHIKPELQQCMGLAESELRIAYPRFLDCLTDWCKNKNCFLQDINCRENDPLQMTSEKLRTILEANSKKRGNHNLTTSVLKKYSPQ
jgi:hypothetical protein